MVHPFPPVKLAKWLHNTITDNNPVSLISISQCAPTYKIRTKEKKKEYNNPAISAVGLMEATASARVV
jgi:hypothetical protein